MLGRDTVVPDALGSGTAGLDIVAREPMGSKLLWWWGVGGGRPNIRPMFGLGKLTRKVALLVSA